ncbi:acyl-CoA dehydrogenase family protein [Actinomadura citrea]|uniref:Alkylation response protein AidB-like acyl-CoA dehydrogenase n=1 Tax=Actinomadura citrea TaxID=46158 RepID=A0A7Y9GDI5_9ACTN|nr:acyl-CoA dehydrogenase family protein [Actinomadura citrea]NYE14563.1 alkylation response protein AidB-like acyl-CoA dehydrogenase [Actinomadura citrea]
MTTTMTDERTALDAAVRAAADHADEADRTGRLSDEAVAAVAATALPRHFVPARWGGAESTFRELTAAVVRLGEACASTAWCAAMLAYTGRFAAHLPIEGQRDLWDGTPGTLLVPGLVPAGSAEETEGGFLLRGRWRYVSGVEFADWAFISGPAGGGIEPRFFAVPRADFTFEPSWDAVGMRATGSHTLVVDEAFVPAHRTALFKEVMGGMNHTSQAPQHNAPLPAVGGLTCISALIGAARGALASATRTAAAKRASGPPAGAPRTGGPPPAGDAASVDLATSAARIEAAELLIDQVVSALDAGEGRPRAFENANRASYAASLLVEAVNALMKSAGTAAQDRSAPLQRCWRDVTVGCSHAALRPERAASGFVEALAKRT